MARDRDGYRRAAMAWPALCLISAFYTVKVVAENCGDPLASCYVGNAKAGGGSYWKGSRNRLWAPFSAGRLRRFFAPIVNISAAAAGHLPPSYVFHRQ